jgi:hypothetical protein
MLAIGKKIGLVGMLAAITLGGGGCQRHREPVMALAPHPDEIEVRRNVQFADLPAPKNFKFNRKFSKNFQGSSLRGGAVVYDGTWNVAETSQWYLAEMPKTYWRLTDTVFVNDYDVTHTFAQGDEIAVLRIWRPANDNARVEINLDKRATAPEDVSRFYE